MIGQKMLMVGKVNVNILFLPFLLEYQNTVHPTQTLKGYIKQLDWLGVHLITEYIS